MPKLGKLKAGLKHNMIQNANTVKLRNEFSEHLTMYTSMVIYREPEREWN